MPNTIWSKRQHEFSKFGSPLLRLGARPPGGFSRARSERSGCFVALASGFDSDHDALPIRACARVLNAKAATDDVLACYRGLAGNGVRRIALRSDSAGGNLALGLASRHRR